MHSWSGIEVESPNRQSNNQGNRSWKCNTWGGIYDLRYRKSYSRKNEGYE